MKTKTSGRIETRLIHAGEPKPRIEGAVSIPVFQSSTFEYSGQEGCHELRYARLNNTPNHNAVHEKLAAVENGESALVTSSGMSAISTTLLAILGSGDHLLAQNCLYGGTYDLLNVDLPALGISHSTLDGSSPGTWKNSLRPETRVLYVETMTNPLLQVADLESAVEFAAKNGLISIIDNTFASPINFRPLDWGFDLSLHSCTKYLNGHSDIVAGAVIGKKELIEKVTRKLNHLGGSLDPHACFLLHRGLKTLSLRVRYQNESAAAIARFLERQPGVARVHYPGLESHPDHHRARRLLDGFGGVVSFELEGGVDRADAFMGNSTLCVSAPSLGGVETLITRPVTTSHSGVCLEDLRAMGISETLIRLSVGIENPDDLMEDLDRALRAAA